MSNKCGVLNCKGNYNKFNKCRVFRLPKKRRWKTILYRCCTCSDFFLIDPRKFFICDRHCRTSKYPEVTLPGGHTSIMSGVLTNEKIASAYVAGWLEFEWHEKLSLVIFFGDDDQLLDTTVKDFIEKASRGSLSVPHVSTFRLVEAGLCYVKQTRNRVCCRDRRIRILSIIDHFYNHILDIK